jgi:hypothetical protein
MKNFVTLAVVLAGLVLQISGEAYYVKLHKTSDSICTILTEETLRKFVGIPEHDALQVTVKDAWSLPSDSGEAELPDDSKIVEIYGRKKDTVDAHVDFLCKEKNTVQPLKLDFGAKAPEVVQIVNNGDKSNRIDVVFMGDGYTAPERQKFFDDIARLTKDMFEGDTFKSYLPVFNIWAIYDESVDSGIGYNGAKNTPFRLYRQAGQLRGIYPGNPSYARQVCQLTGTGGCDYPSLIGNDDYYGGLGGEFVISTKSDRTGTVVLRHEMGHNFINVGEEYDNGQVYSGVNAARSLATLGWTSWLTGPLREERSIYRILEYPWHNLANGIKSFTFISDGNYHSWYLLVSVSAAGEEDSLEFLLDGQVLPWATRGFDDREFYDWYGETGFTPGQHTFSVRSKTNPTNPDIPRMIASVTLHEFGSPSEYNQSPDYVSAYPTWSVSRVKTFRPTNAACLMRNMTNNIFCPVCREGMWMQFFQRISLIDSVSVNLREVKVETVKLGQLREGGVIPGEELEVTWYLNNVEQEDLKNQFEVSNASQGNWRVQVKFITPEVRRDPNNLLTDSQTFTVS